MKWVVYYISFLTLSWFVFGSESSLNYNYEKGEENNLEGWKSPGWGEVQEVKKEEKELVLLEFLLLGGLGIIKCWKLVATTFLTLLPLFTFGVLLNLVGILLLGASLLNTSSGSTPVTTTPTPVTTTPAPANIMFYGDTDFGNYLGDAQLPFGQCLSAPGGLDFSSIMTGGACLALYQMDNCAPSNAYYFVKGDVPDLGVFSGTVTMSLMVIPCPP